MPDGLFINWAPEPLQMVVTHAGVPLNAMSVEAKVGREFAYQGDRFGSLHLTADLDVIEPIEVECPVAFLSVEPVHPGVSVSRQNGFHSLWIKLDGEMVRAKLNGVEWLGIHSARIVMDIQRGTRFYLHYTITQHGKDEEWVACLQRLNETTAGA